jgi:hypothetical protein
MTTPVDPNDPNAQQANETYAQWQFRLADAAYKAGKGGTGPNVAMAAGALAFVQSPSVPKSFDIK